MWTGVLLTGLLGCWEAPAPPVVEPPAAPEAPAPRGRRPSRRPEHLRDAPDEGKWRRLKEADPEDAELVARLEALGYVDGTEAITPSQTITVHDPRAVDGLNLVCSGHGPEAWLMDMDGAVLHRWSASFEEVFPERAASRRDALDYPGTHHWRRVRLLPDGGLLAIWEGQGLVRLDRDSRVVWSSEERAHHDMAFLEDGTLAVLVRDIGVHERMSRRPVAADAVALLDPDTGRLLRKVSLVDALLDHDEAWLRGRAPSHGDVLHINSLHRLDGSVATKAPAFARGRLLVSMRTLDALAVLDLEEGIVWTHTGPYRAQHDAELFSTGELVLFDNVGGEGGSRVLAFDPATGERMWTVDGAQPPSFRSRTLGAQQELPGGHLLITESDRGRALELDRATDEVVWEFWNPHRAGPEGEFIAVLFEVVRVDRAAVADWLPLAR